MTTRTLTALFADHATAELAAERLRAAGVPEKSIETRRADEGDIAPGNAPSGGLFAVGDLLRTEFDTPGITRGVEAGGTVLVAFGVPEDLHSEALRILREEATEVEDRRDPDPE